MSTRMAYLIESSDDKSIKYLQNSFVLPMHNQD